MAQLLEAVTVVGDTQLVVTLTLAPLVKVGNAHLAFACLPNGRGLGGVDLGGVDHDGIDPGCGVGHAHPSKGPAHCRVLPDHWATAVLVVAAQVDWAREAAERVIPRLPRPLADPSAPRSQSSRGSRGRRGRGRRGRGRSDDGRERQRGRGLLLRLRESVALSGALAVGGGAQERTVGLAPQVPSGVPLPRARGQAKHAWGRGQKVKGVKGEAQQGTDTKVKIYNR